MGQYASDESKKDYWDAAVQYPVDKIKSAVAASTLSHMASIFCDHTYWCLPQSEVDKMLGEINTNSFTYITDRFDCDKFALQFCAKSNLIYGTNAVGLILDSGGKHSYNCVVIAGEGDADPTVAVYEPQNDQPVLSPHDHYQEQDGMVLFL